jgi:hypothetical protein
MTQGDATSQGEPVPVNQQPRTVAITELTMAMGGIYLVTTQMSTTYEFTLRGSKKSEVLRRSNSAGTDSCASTPSSLVSIKSCIVGGNAYFKMEAHARGIDFYWQLTTEIVSIDQLPDPGPESSISLGRA